MALRYIAGRAGMGKSRQVLAEIEMNLKAGYPGPLILLVPEQYTLQAERDLIKQLHLPGIMQVEVLSFTRMANRVLNETGGITRTIIDDKGKYMVLRRVINQVHSGLTIYKKACRQPGFVIQCSSLLAELKQYNLSASDLLSRGRDLDQGSPAHWKLHDIALIYSAFESYMEGCYLDNESHLDLFIRQLGSSTCFQNARLWIDNFTTFSPQSLKIIEHLLPLARETCISLTVNRTPGARDHNLFTLSHLTWRRLHEMAQRLGLKEETVLVDQPAPCALKPPELVHLERELYAYPTRIWPDEVSHIHIFAAASIYSEVEQMAATAVRLVRDHGYRWQDMAVVCENLDTYGPIIKRVFADYDIPLFMDQKRDITGHPVVQFLLSSLDVLLRGYRYEDICRYGKTGFTVLATAEFEEMENYLLRYGIRGSAWKTEFTAGPPENLERLNQWRKALAEPLHKLELRFAGQKTFAGLTRSLYEYLMELNLEEVLAEEIRQMNLRGLYERENENAQIWNVVLETMDQLYRVMGDQQADLKEFRQVLESGFAAVELGIIPSTLEQVLVGSIQRSKSQELKVLFVLGLNDGVLPGAGNKESLLTDEERERLQELELEIGMSREMQSLQENFLIYNAFSKPEVELRLSYALSDSEGRALRPSLLVSRIKKIYPALEPESDLIEAGSAGIESVATPGSTLKYLTKNLRQGLEGNPIPDFWRDVFTWYGEEAGWREKRNFIARGLFHRNQPGNLPPHLLERVYRRPWRSSVSRMELFINCPFAHFIRYGLKPGERKTYQVAPPDIGELFHSALLGFAARMEGGANSWWNLPREECGRLMDQVMDEIVPAQSGGIFTSTCRNRYLVNRLKRIGRRTAWVVAEQIRSGGFIPRGHEISFGPDGILPGLKINAGDGGEWWLEGRIDRLDILDSRDGGFVRIIDYKTGGKNFKLSDAYYGLSLQLLVYLAAVLAGSGQLGRKNLQPGGIFYFKIDDPLVRSDDDDPDTLERLINREFKLDGLLIKDETVARAMDAKLEGYSDIIPAGINRSGEFHQRSAVLTGVEFADLISHARHLLGRTAGEIMQGRVKIEPVMMDQRKACDYCRFGAVCQFDQMLEENRYRRLQRLDHDEVIKRISAGREGGETR